MERFSIEYNGTHYEVYATESEAVERFSELYDNAEQHSIKNAQVTEHGKVIYGFTR